MVDKGKRKKANRRAASEAVREAAEGLLDELRHLSVLRLHQYASFEQALLDCPAFNYLEKVVLRCIAIEANEALSRPPSTVDVSLLEKRMAWLLTAHETWASADPADMLCVWAGTASAPRCSGRSTGRWRGRGRKAALVRAGGRAGGGGGQVQAGAAAQRLAAAASTVLRSLALAPGCAQQRGWMRLQLGFEQPAACAAEEGGAGALLDRSMRQLVEDRLIRVSAPSRPYGPVRGGARGRGPREGGEGELHDGLVLTLAVHEHELFFHEPRLEEVVREQQRQRAAAAGW